MKKKVVSLCLVALLAMGTLIGGTMAYFTDKDQVDNVFTVGNVDITLDEAEVERDGDVWIIQDNRVHENEYKDVFPGAVLPKDPTVHNVGSYDAYVRVKITVDFNKLAAMQEDKVIFNGTTEDEDLTNILNIDTNHWTYVADSRSIDMSGDNRNVTYTYTYNTALTADDDTTPVFTVVKIPDFVTNEDVTTYGLQTFNIDVVAEAIQTAGFADAAAAWAAFDGE